MPSEQGVIMMDSVRSAFHTQLATVMDSLLAAAVCEIAKIFEGSLCEQQEELTQRGQEISVLRGRLEQADRRLKEAQRKGREGGEDGREATGPARRAGETSPSQRSESGEGLSWGEDVLSQPDPLFQGADCESHPRVKEETAAQEGSAIKQELDERCHGSESDEIQGPEGSCDVGDQNVGDTLSDTPEGELSHWEEDHREDLRPRHHQNQNPNPFLQVSLDGRCSPRPDPSPALHREWLPGLDTRRSGAACLDLKAEEAGGITGTGATCFRPSLCLEELSDEEDPTDLFLDQHHDQAPDERETPHDQPHVYHAHRGQSPWRPRDDRARGLLHQARRTFSPKDPLRPHTPNTLSHTHKLSHVGGSRPYTCPYCGKGFTYPSHQRRHLLRHTGVRLHPCTMCDKSFLTPSELTVHTRVHTGERPFGCAQCGKRFARSGNLRAHQRDVHLGKRPFACAECGKRFAHKGNLRVHHQRVHQGEPNHPDLQDDGSALPSTE